jgi:hypothetical protein
MTAAVLSSANSLTTAPETSDEGLGQLVDEELDTFEAQGVSLRRSSITRSAIVMEVGERLTEDRGTTSKAIRKIISRLLARRA